MAKWFKYLGGSYIHQHVTPKGNKYPFYRGRPYLVKDEEDIEYFEDHVNFELSEAPNIPEDDTGPGEPPVPQDGVCQHCEGKGCEACDATKLEDLDKLSLEDLRKRVEDRGIVIKGRPTKAKLKKALLQDN